MPARFLAPQIVRVNGKYNVNLVKVFRHQSELRLASVHPGSFFYSDAAWKCDRGSLAGGLLNHAQVAAGKAE